MRVLTCSVDQSPCPDASAVWVDLVSLLMDPAALGLDAETILLVASYGAAPVIGAYLLGYGISLTVGMIKKI